ncbi:MAG: 7,8-dihydro-8-oxoguanine triphosphatase-like [Parcubacteria group bacterium]|nr:7,8-dihydro-8-oxoguanine triphosphatase-like [Parcubacteria group bacterium]
MKKIRFGAGMWNGFGGKVEEGESLESAAYRELEEEAGIVALNMQKMGVLNLSFNEDPAQLEVHVFKTTEFMGEIIESNEMKSQWFDFDEIPYEKMWTDDEQWLPLLLAGTQFEGTFHFDRPSTPEYSAKILTQELRLIG